MTVPITTDAAVSDAPDDEAGLGALQTERGNLPLDRIDVRAEIVGLTSEVELTQDFVNTFDVPLEASYVFPLPDRAAVTGMRMTSGARVVTAELTERETARRTYDLAVESGRRAAIAEEERPDVFTIRVGNILPGERVSVAITLVTPLSYQDGEAIFRFPLVVAPRYIPGENLEGPSVGDGYADDTDAVPDASRITPPVLLPGFPHPVALSIEVGIEPAGLALSDVRSSLPTQTLDNGRIRVQPGERADRDFVLRLRYGTEYLSDSLVLVPDADGEEGTYQLTVLPPVSSAPPRPRDVVLLLDRSGSMAGWKLSAARRAVARIIDSLTDTDRFAVLTFDAQIAHPEGLPAGLIEATDRNRFHAVEHLAVVESGSGTELFPPFRNALELLSATNGDAVREAIVVLVTDGQVGNEDQLLLGLSGDLHHVRVHAIGIDKAVNAGLLGRLADAGGGRFELVESEDRLDEALGAIQRRIGTPLAHSLALHAENLTIIDGTTSPARLPDLFPGVPLVVVGRYRASAGGSLVLRGTDSDGTDWSVTVAGQRLNVSAVTTQWARAHLRDLEDRYASASDRNGSGSLQDLAKRIIETSLRFGVLCRFTAYIARQRGDDRIIANGQVPHRVLQPVETPAGWAREADGAAVPSLPASGKSASVPAARAERHGESSRSKSQPGSARGKRNVVALAVVGLLLFGGGGWIWSLSGGGPSSSTRDGIAAGKTEAPNPYRSEPSGRIPATMGGGIADQSPVSPAPLTPPTDNTLKRDIITTGSLQLVVHEPGPAADRLIAAVNDAGGRVDSRSERSGPSGDRTPTVALVLRVPADKLDAVLADAKKLGTVGSMSISHTDVTTQRVDLDARIGALQTSVKRLLELMSKAGTVSDLLAAESSLTQRQAELDSLKAQRSTLGDEISYATINVTISAQPTVSHAGFLGALANGWHALTSVANGALLAVGFLIPWMVPLAVLVLVLVLILRRRSTSRTPVSESGSQD
ncbi:hypothetical protein A5634_02340 [Mycobacterium asiaticum]|uniref:Trypsin n=1 Tax=Mycobacterium asiaticum TaxID=1790 RepID=A0A1A3NS21_MYCAS|nr:DUF4349 domain-containing protein [Mycobacterium asiaticum]OBK24868.1 hypothetical protein A5634_02340 [Mycobacterium asiaticum]